MASMLVTFLYIIWCSGLNPEVLAAEGNGANGVNGGAELPRTKGQNDDTITEGDIVVSKRKADKLFENADTSGERRKRQAAIGRDQYGKWTEGVNYVFSPDAGDGLKRCFRKAAEAWERDTCINFKELKEGAGDYLYVFDDGDYYSHVGKFGGRQNISLDSDCRFVIGRAIHEIGHALGLYHTDSRYDRDSYVTVAEDYLKNYTNEFRIIPKNESETYGTGYDYGSIMHLSYPIVVPTDEKYARTLGSYMLSFTDLLSINKHYGCLDKCDKGEFVKCENGGFPHPRKCNKKCICPSGYGGSKCKARPGANVCGEILMAKAEPKLLALTIKNNRTIYDYANCTYWIKSPKDTVIEIEIDGMPFEFKAPGCVKAGVEIKTNENQTLTGYRFCAPEDKRIKLRSHSNFVPIIVYNNRGYLFAMELKYRYVRKNSY